MSLRSDLLLHLSEFGVKKLALINGELMFTLNEVYEDLDYLDDDIEWDYVANNFALHRLDCFKEWINDRTGTINIMDIVSLQVSDLIDDMGSIAINLLIDEYLNDIIDEYENRYY